MDHFLTVGKKIRLKALANMFKLGSFLYDMDKCGASGGEEQGCISKSLEYTILYILEHLKKCLSGCG